MTSCAKCAEKRKRGGWQRRLPLSVCSIRRGAITGRGGALPPGPAGRFRAPGHGVFPAHPCQGRFRAPARGPFGTAQKGRKGRLGAAAPKNPFDVQQIAIFSFRRVDIVLPLRPLPGLRPCPSRHPNCFSPDPAPAAAVEGAGSPKSPPHHEQQEEKRSYCHLVLATTTQQADRRTWESAKVRR